MRTHSVTIGFVGVGTLGRGLALALAAAGCSVTAASSRAGASAEWLAQRIPGCVAMPAAQNVADACDLVFITTPDAAIADVAASVNWRPGQGVAHCCGAASTELLASAEAAGASVGALHPFQTFAALSDPAEAARRLSGVTFAVSAAGWLADYLPYLAQRLDGRAISIPDELRPIYHASAVLACGYVTTLLDAAVSLWTRMGLTEQDGLRAAVPLARATIEAIAANGPVAAATGPAVRGDASTIATHLAALSQHAPQIFPLYRELAQASIPLARAKGIPEPNLAALNTLISSPLETSTMSNSPDTQSLETFSQSLLSRLSNDPDWFLYDALNRAEPLGRQLKPWEDLDHRQRAAIVRHVNDMSSWRAEGKVDSSDADHRFNADPKLRELLA